MNTSHSPNVSHNPSHAVFGQCFPQKITEEACLWVLFNIQRKTDLGPYRLGWLGPSPHPASLFWCWTCPIAVPLISDQFAANRSKYITLWTWHFLWWHPSEIYWYFSLRNKIIIFPFKKKMHSMIPCVNEQRDAFLAPVCFWLSLISPFIPVIIFLNKSQCAFQISSCTLLTIEILGFKAQSTQGLVSEFSGSSTPGSWRIPLKSYHSFYSWNGAWGHF